MRQLDIKKIITSFLVLAIIAAFVTTIASNLSASGSPSQQYEQHLKITGQVAPQIDEGAPAEALPAQTGSLYGATDAAVSSASDTATFTDSPGNLTQQFAAKVAQQLVQANPAGPDATGDQPAITVPDDLGDSVQNFLDQQSLSYIPPPIDESKIKTSATVAPGDISTYLTSVTRILSDASGATGLAGVQNKLTAGSTDVAPILAANLLLSDAQTKLYGLSVPVSLLSFHKHTLQLLSAEKDALDVDSQDPLKSLLALQNLDYTLNVNQSLLRADVVALQKEQSTNGPTSLLRNNRGPIISLLGANTAYAIPVEDFVTEIETTLTTESELVQQGLSIKEYIIQVLTEILKDQLIHRLVQEVIKWVQGGGKPNFVQDWKGFLENVGKSAASQVLSDVAPGLCKPFGPLLTIIFTPTQTNDITKQYKCTLDQVVQNVTDFYNDFQNGGWIAYGQAFQPNNNLFGAIVKIDDAVTIKSAAAVDNKSQELGANRGFQGTNQCIASTVETVSFETYNSLKDSESFEELISSSSPQIDPATGQVTGGDYTIRLCKPGASVATTPGSIVASQLDQALGSPIQRIVNAQDIVALVNALIDSALHKLIGLARGGVTGLFQGGPAGGGGPSPISTSTDPCFGLSGQALTDCRGTVGGPGGGGGVDQSAKDALMQTATTLADALQRTVDSDTQWLALADSTKQALQNLETACVDLADIAAARIATINDLTSTVQDESEQAGVDLNRINAIKNAIQTTTSTGALSDLQAQLGQFDTQTIATAAGTAAQRVSSLQALKDAVDAAASSAAGGSCTATTLPDL